MEHSIVSSKLFFIQMSRLTVLAYTVIKIRDRTELERKKTNKNLEIAK